MDLNQKLLLKNEAKSNVIVKLKDWDPDMDLGKSKKDSESEIGGIFNQLAEHSTNFLQRIKGPF